MLAVYLLVLIAYYLPVALTQTQCTTCPSGWSVDMNGCCIKQQTGATNTSCALSHTGAYAVDESQVIAAQIQLLNMTVAANIPGVVGQGDIVVVLPGLDKFLFNRERQALHLVLCVGCTQQYCKYCPASA